MARAEAYLHAKFDLDPSYPLTTIHNVTDRTGQTNKQTDRIDDGLIA